MAHEVLLPTTTADAIAAFGDGSGVTVLAGGTILMPELVHRRVRPERVLALARAGLAGVDRADGVVRIGAATPVAALEDGDEPLATAARHVADVEIRAQATLGGNLCAGPGGEAPRGDLQAPLLVLGASARSVGAGGERTEPLQDFLAGAANRLLLEVTYPDVARQAGYAAARRPHAHHYTILAVAAVREDGETRVAATGAAPHAVRLPSVEHALAAGEPHSIAGHKAIDDVDPPDDALASAWYRRRVLPTLVAQALDALS